MLGSAAQLRSGPRPVRGRLYHRELPEQQLRVYFHIKNDPKRQTRDCENWAKEDLDHIDDGYSTVRPPCSQCTPFEHEFDDTVDQWWQRG